MKELSIEEKTKAYDEAIKKAKDMLSYKEVRQEDIEYLFPELIESDEKIREEIINYFECQSRDEPCRKSIHDKWVAWLEKQGKKNQLYIRFGDIPKDEKSKVYNGEIEIGTENGVSVYPAFEDSEGDIVLGLSLPITKTTLYTQQHLLEYDNRPCYLVSGDYVGKGTDGEPLLKNVKVIREIKNFRRKQDEQKSFDYEATDIQQKD